MQERKVDLAGEVAKGSPVEAGQSVGLLDAPPLSSRAAPEGGRETISLPQKGHEPTLIMVLECLPGIPL
jgi:hypothetical protein